MSRLLFNSLQVPLDADIDDSDTTITFTAPLREWGEDNIATISGGDTLALKVGNELLHITAYTSGALSATVTRGQEGSTATAHAEGDILRHDATSLDYSGGADLSDYAELAGATFTGDVVVPDDAYNATSWNGSLEVPTKNALRDKIETLGGGSSAAEDITITDTGGYFTGSDVEAALQELGANVGGGSEIAGTILGIKVYDPTATDTSTSGTSLADIDATNLAVTFTVPDSGKVLVTLVAAAYGAATSFLQWGLREGSTDIAGPVSITQDTNHFTFTRSFLITGLTPGASKTYKWAHCRSSATNGSTRYGGIYGQALMVVSAAPF